MSISMTPQQAALAKSDKGAFALYRDLVAQDCSYGYLALYELVTLLLSGLPGLAGYGLRSFAYPFLFGECGKRPAFGRSVLIRNPKRISLGQKVMVDDFATLDVHSGKGNISLGDFVSIGRFTSIVSKAAEISLQDGVNIGSYCRIASQSKVTIGASSLVAAYCYIGPGNHQSGDDDVPLIEREMEIKGGVSIGKNVWIGARATILDGVSIGDGAIVGAHSLVRDNVRAGAVVVGTPAKEIELSGKHKSGRP